MYSTTNSTGSRMNAQRGSGSVDDRYENDGSLHVLLVEDSLGDELMAIRALDSSKIKHRLDTLRTGHQVLPYLENCLKDQERLPDVIMLDLGMPGVDGFSVLEYMAASSAEFKKIPIILTTGYAHVEYLPKTSHLPILASIEKPCTKEKLQAALAGLGRDFEYTD